jgi:signal transduction histidine kinase/CheY-like chemotaxis protein
MTPSLFGAPPSTPGVPTLPSAADVDRAANAALQRRRGWALALTALIGLLLPSAYLWIEWRSTLARVALEADSVADDVTEIASRDPAGWGYHIGRYTLIGAEVLEHEPGAAMHIRTADARTVMTAGNWPLAWPFEASSPVYDAGVEVGTVTVQYPSGDMRTRVMAVLIGSLIAAALAYVMIAHVAIGDVQRQMAQLRALRDAAERAGTARAAFLAAMSHEIRTPMNGVIGLIDLMRDTPLDARQRGYMEVMRRSGETLLRVINDVLDFSRLESGRVDIEALPYEPAAVTREVTELLGPMAQAKGLRLACELDPDLHDWALGDAGRVRQVLLNLVGNAIKFSARGEVRLTLAAPEPGRLRWSVSDQGIGMSPSQLVRVFSPFVQADASVARRYGGSGLGLAISRHLVRAMGGELGATSEAGIGSTFSFEIKAPPAKAPAPPPITGFGDVGVEGLRVLVVEDNDVNTLIATAMLEGLGVSADVVDDGARAIEAVRQHHYDLVLMDLAMAGLDGLEATRRIRGLGAAVHQPRIVALTANVVDRVREECRAAGMDDYLGKPFRRDELRRTLERAL